MWTIENMVALIILMGLSVMDIKIRKVPRDFLLLCVSGAVVYQICGSHMDWMLVLAGGIVGILFLGISKITKEAIGYGDSMAILILGIYMGVWKLLAVLGTAFFLLSILGAGCIVIRRGKKGLAFPFYPFLTVGYLLGIWMGGM